MMIQKALWNEVCFFIKLLLTSSLRKENDDNNIHQVGLAVYDK